MALVDIENMCFGTHRFKTKRLNHSENALENYLFMYQIGYWHPLIEIPNDAPVTSSVGQRPAIGYVHTF